MSNQPQTINEFWQWFKAHQLDFDELTDTASPFWDKAVSRLKQIDKNLWFEMSLPDGLGREFIITAEGHKESFSVVEGIVANAPSISGWQFIALKPPMGFDFTTAYEDIQFEPRAMWFLPLEGESSPSDLGLRVGVPNFSKTIERQASNAVAVILETGLGERSAALDIQHLEVSSLP